MAKLSNFGINPDAIRDGEWVRPGADFDDLEILTRGFTDAFNNARAAKLRRAAQLQCSGDVQQLPTEVFRAVTQECVVEHCLLDVRNLVDDAGEPVGLAAFTDVIRDPKYPDLYAAVLRAIGAVGLRKADNIEVGAKN